LPSTPYISTLSLHDALPILPALKERGFEVPSAETSNAQPSAGAVFKLFERSRVNRMSNPFNHESSTHSRFGAIGPRMLLIALVLFSVPATAQVYPVNGVFSAI